MEKKISEITTELNKYREESLGKEHQIKELNKGMEIGNAHVRDLEDELNTYKQKFYNLEVKENKAKQRIQDLQQELQRRDSSTEVKDLKQHVQEIEEEKNAYLEQIRQKENELNELKQSAVLEHKQILEASRQEIMDLGNAEHNRILSEKVKEMQELKKKYSELEKEYNEAYENIPHYVKREAMKLSMKAIGEKDQEIRRLQEQINQLLSQQSSQKTEMEMEEPKTRPERIEIEEVNPRHGMQTRSQGLQVLGKRFIKRNMIHLEI